MANNTASILGNKNKKQSSVEWKFPLDKENFKWLAIGLGVIVLGYILMFTGVTEEPAVESGTWNNFMAVTLAPVLLVIGYMGIVPYAILKKSKTSENVNEENN